MFFIACPLVFCAGFVDSIGGGGGIISLPAYIFAGLPAHYAIATNKLSSAMGTAVSTARYCKNGYCDYSLAIPGIIAALIGAQFGSKLALSVSDSVLKTVMIFILPVIAVFILRKPKMETIKKKELSKTYQIVIISVSSLLIGLYDGFYGPGTGTFLILTFTALAGMSPLTAAGNTKLINLASNISALLVFLRSGYILIPLALATSVFSILGHYLGAGFAIKKGEKIIRPIIIGVIILLFFKVIFDF